MNQIRQTSTLAIASLVAGLLGWTLLPMVGCIAAIITGHMARAEIRREPERLEGDGLAIAGLILGWLGIAVSVLAVVVIFMLFGGLAWFAAMQS